MLSQAGGSLASAYGAGNINMDAPMFQAFGKFGQGGKTAQPGPASPKSEITQPSYKSKAELKQKYPDKARTMGDVMERENWMRMYGEPYGSMYYGG